MKKLIIPLVVVLLCTSLVSCSRQLVKMNDSSMSPTIKSGESVLCDTSVDKSTLEVGDIIAYYTIIDGEKTTQIHRIVNIYDGGDHLIFETKGDANTDADSLTVHEAEVLGKILHKS